MSIAVERPSWSRREPSLLEGERCVCGVTYQWRQADGSWHCKVCGKNVCQSRDFGGLPLSVIEAMLNDVNKLGNPAKDRVTHGSVRYWFNDPWELSRFLMAVIRQTTAPAPE